MLSISANRSTGQLLDRRQRLESAVRILAEELAGAPGVHGDDVDRMPGGVVEVTGDAHPLLDGGQRTLAGGVTSEFLESLVRSRARSPPSQQALHNNAVWNSSDHGAAAIETAELKRVRRIHRRPRRATGPAAPLRTAVPPSRRA